MTLMNIPNLTLRILHALLFLLFGVNFRNLILSGRQKNYILVSLSVVLMTIEYVLAHILHLVALNVPREVYLFLQDPRIVGMRMADILVFLVTAGIISVFQIFQIAQWDRDYVTPATIQECAEVLPVGICCYRESGRILFSNSTMNRLSLKLGCGELLNGNVLSQNLSGTLIDLKDDGIWEIQRSNRMFRGAVLHEIIVSDVTEISRKTEELREKTRNVELLKEELMEYNRHIDDTVRMQEILQAKVNIHDEMNRIMLLASASIDTGANEQTKHEILDYLRTNFWLMKADQRIDKDQGMEELEKLAGLLDVTLVREGVVPVLGPKAMNFFKIAVREAIANAVKHADADVLYIRTNAQDGFVCCTFENDIRDDESHLQLNGGLRSLQTLAEQMDGNIEIRKDDRFHLTVTFRNDAG